MKIFKKKLKSNFEFAVPVQPLEKVTNDTLILLATICGLNYHNLNNFVHIVLQFTWKHKKH